MCGSYPWSVLLSKWCKWWWLDPSLEKQTEDPGSSAIYCYVQCQLQFKKYCKQILSSSDLCANFHEILSILSHSKMHCKSRKKLEQNSRLLATSVSETLTPSTLRPKLGFCLTDFKQSHQFQSFIGKQSPCQPTLDCSPQTMFWNLWRMSGGWKVAHKITVAEGEYLRVSSSRTIKVVVLTVAEVMKRSFRIRRTMNHLRGCAF